MINNSVLICGDSGSGKTFSIRSLEPKETLIIQMTPKMLGWKNWRKDYQELQKDGKTGNLAVINDNVKGKGLQSERIIGTIKFILKNRPDIKNIIIDDLQYLASFEFLRRSNETGFNKFTDIANHLFNVINYVVSIPRDDMFFFFMNHEDRDVNNNSRKIKTIGKLLDEKIVLEGLFNTVLFTRKDDKGYHFETQSFNGSTAKTPYEMFDKLLIPNDLQGVITKIKEF